MKTLLEFLVTAWDNKHTTTAGIVYVLCKFGAVWFPDHKSQFEATEAIAVGYGLLKAGDARMSAPNAQKAVDAPPKPGA